ncbi:TetR/AcrR family transcriptional regulator [Paucilactobacillus kaifaensis]|uniref:TetR/AcrR family transcriptional regulator n=1 Tax=Paucilactobacillus kaifaensis TaxID=2559921 RepID=UPI0010F470ED|nr:TetR-like C-terminal domain-containing protein [Paucilactobacillus kaifaensis]
MTKQSTKLQLATALKDLMQTMPLERITIDKLTQTANLTRNTFYYHFDDVYALLAWIYHQEIVTQLAAYKQVSNWQDGYRLLLDYIATNQQFCLHTFHSVGRDLLDNFLYQVASDMVRGVVIDINPHISTQLQASIVNFYGWALVIQVIQWLVHSLDDTKDTMVKRIEIMMTGTIAHTIKNGLKME